MKKILILLPALVMAFVFSSTIFTPNAEAKNYRHNGKHFKHRGHHGNSHFKHYRHGKRHYKKHRYKRRGHRYNSYRSYRHRHHAGCDHYGHDYYRKSGAHFSIHVPLFDHFYYRH